MISPKELVDRSALIQKSEGRGVSNPFRFLFHVVNLGYHILEARELQAR